MRYRRCRRCLEHFAGGGGVRQEANDGTLDLGKPLLVTRSPTHHATMNHRAARRLDLACVRRLGGLGPRQGPHAGACRAVEVRFGELAVAVADLVNGHVATVAEDQLIT